jgi:hypothetical protein
MKLNLNLGKILFLVSISCISSVHSVFAMGRGAPTDPPSKPLNAACATPDPQPAGSFERTRTVTLVSWVSCYYMIYNSCAESTNMENRSEEYSISEPDIQKQAEEVARDRGFKVDPNHLVSFQLGDWVRFSQDGPTPIGRQDSRDIGDRQLYHFHDKQIVSVFESRNTSELKEARCKAINACLPTLQDSDEILNTTQWAHQLGCPTLDIVKQE